MRLMELTEQVRKDSYTAFLTRLANEYFRAGKNCRAYKTIYLLSKYRSSALKHITMIKDKRRDKWYPVNRQK